MTKGDIVNGAFTEMGLSSYVFTLQPEDVELGLSTLEALVARLDVDGIELNWPYANDISDVPGNIELEIPMYAQSGLIAQLAVDLCSSFGKSPAPTTLLKAKKGYETMLAVSAVPNSIASNKYVALGSGNKPWRWRRVFLTNENPHRVNPSNRGISPNVESKRE